MSTNAFTATAGGSIHLADDFHIPAGTTWTITSITVFAYQLNSTSTSSFNDARLQILTWDSANPGLPIFGNLTTNRFSSTYFTNTYRDSESTIGNTQRPIMAIEIKVNQTFPAGSYFIDYQVGGTLSGGAGSPPVTIAGLTGKPESLAYGLFTGGTGVFLQDSSTAAFQDLPFLIKGFNPSTTVSITGRVLQSSGGRGVTNATVTLTGPSGQPRTTITNRTGYYQFDQIQPGQTYSVSVTARRFGFTPRTIQVIDPITDYDFVPAP